MRNVKRFLGLAAVTCSVLAHGQSHWVDPRLPKSVEEERFRVTVSREIYQVLPQNRESFESTLAERLNPVFPGATINSFEKAECERLAGFTMEGYANEQGHLYVAACSDGERIRELAERTRENLSNWLKGPMSEARKIGWYYARDLLSDGSVFYYFPVIAISHGAITLYTGVLYDTYTKRSVVIHVTRDPLCASGYYQDFPLCKDVQGTLKALALRVARL